MTQDNASETGGKSRKELAAEARAERLRKQLRDNLHKRKAQGRARKATTPKKG